MTQYLIFGESITAWLVAITGALALCVSVWAVWLLRRTLTATNNAVIQAEKGTRAAQKAVEETRRLGEAQVRAYLAPGMLKWFAANDEIEDFAIKLQFTVRNAGQSPALRVMHSTRCGIREDKLPDDYDFAKDIWPTEGEFNLAPGESSKGDMHFISREELEEIKSGKLFCYVGAIAIYFDVFRKEGDAPRVIRHTYQIKPDKLAINGPLVEFFGWGGSLNNEAT